MTPRHASRISVRCATAAVSAALTYMPATLAAQGSTAGPRDAVAITAEPRHHIAFANADVRVFDVVVPPNDTTLYHLHETDYTYVTFGDARLVAQALGAEPAPLVIADGEVRFTRGPLRHRVSNPAPTPFHNVTIELLSRSAATPAMPPLSPGDSVVLENDRMRAVRRVVAPGGTIQLAYPAGRALDVFVDAGALDEVVAGSGRRLDVKPGAFAWHEGGERTLHNAGEHAVRIVTIYLK